LGVSRIDFRLEIGVAGRLGVMDLGVAFIALDFGGEFLGCFGLSFALALRDHKDAGLKPTATYTARPLGEGQG
jgi:hypothetical protein